MRVLGAVIALAAVGLDVVPELVMNGLNAATPFYSLIAFSAGCGVAVQQAINGRVALATGQSLFAGWLNFVTGVMALSVVTGILAITGTSPLEPLQNMPWWAATPGLIGAVFVSLAAWAVGIIGVLRLGLLSFTGQIFTALVLDLLTPMAGVEMRTVTALSCLLALCAAIVSSRPPRAHPATTS